MAASKGKRDNHKQKEGKTRQELEAKPKITYEATNPEAYRELCLAFMVEIQERKDAYNKKVLSGELTEEDKIDEILARLSDEGLSLVQACKGIMARSWFNKKKDEDEALKDRYTRACEDREDLYFDLIESVAFNRSEDHTPFTGVNVIQRDKLIVDTLKWKLARMNYRKYGDKIEVEAHHDLAVQLFLNLGDNECPNNNAWDENK